jgi:hypothetical protein
MEGVIGGRGGALVMAKKSYPAWHYYLAGVIAVAIGLTYTVWVFQLILGPGMLIVGGICFAVGYMKTRSARGAAPPPESPSSK